MNSEKALLAVKAKMRDKKFLEPVTLDEEVAKSVEIAERNHRNSVKQVTSSLDEKAKLERYVNSMEQFYSRGNRKD